MSKSTFQTHVSETQNSTFFLETTETHVSRTQTPGTANIPTIPTMNQPVNSAPAYQHPQTEPNLLDLTLPSLPTTTDQSPTFSMHNIPSDFSIPQQQFVQPTIQNQYSGPQFDSHPILPHRSEEPIHSDFNNIENPSDAAKALMGIDKSINTERSNLCAVKLLCRFVLSLFKFNSIHPSEMSHHMVHYKDCEILEEGRKMIFPHNGFAVPLGTKKWTDEQLKKFDII